MQFVNMALWISIVVGLAFLIYLFVRKIVEVSKQKPATFSELGPDVKRFSASAQLQISCHSFADALQGA